MSDAIKVMTSVGAGLLIGNILTDGGVRETLYNKPKYFELMLIGAGIVVVADSLSRKS